jgi:oligopeptidase B
LLEGVDIFQDYLVVSERTNGLNQIRVKRWDDAADYYIEFPDPAYSAYVGATRILTPRSSGTATTA